MELSSEFTFRATHAVKIDGILETPHEHNFKIRITLEGKLREDGFVVDFLKLRKIVNNLIITRLEGANLNDLFEQPSVENIGIWVFKKLEGPIKGLGCRLIGVTVFETDHDWITVRESDL